MAKSTNKKGRKKRTVSDKNLEKIKKAEKKLIPEPVIVKRHLQNGQYISSIHPKKGIFLHHTAGTTAEGAMSWWDQTKERVGTPYVIDRDGTIYECFDPKYWAYHLGIEGDDNKLEKETINIELVSAGWLTDGYFYPLYPSKVAGKKIPEEEIYEVKFRGYKQWHKYTDAQIENLCKLIAKLKRDFPTIELPKKVVNFNEFDPTIYQEGKGGLHTHGNVREDKTDLFPQKNLIKALNSLLKQIA